MSLDTQNREPENLNALPDNVREGFTGYGEYTYSYTGLVDYKLVGDFENGIFKSGKVEKMCGFLEQRRGSVIETLEGDFQRNNQKVSPNYHPVLLQGIQTQLGIEASEKITINNGEFGKDITKDILNSWCLKNGIRVKPDGTRVVVQNFEEVSDRRSIDSDIAKKIDRDGFTNLNELEASELGNFTGKGSYTYDSGHARYNLEGEWENGHLLHGKCKQTNIPGKGYNNETTCVGEFYTTGIKRSPWGPTLFKGTRSSKGLLSQVVMEEGEFTTTGWLLKGKQIMHDGTIIEGTFENIIKDNTGYDYRLKEGTIKKRDGIIVKVKDFKEVTERENDVELEDDNEDNIEVSRNTESQEIDLDNVRLGNFYEIMGSATSSKERSGTYLFGRYGAVTNQGEGYKGLNEDRVVVSEIVNENDEVIGLQMVVIDGMGGYDGGELAAHILAEEFTYGGTFKQIINRARARFRNEPKINKNSLDHDAGTCWVAVRVVGNKGKRAHMGDARMTSWNRRGGFKFRTKDEGSGKFVSNSLGPNDGELVQVDEFELEEGDTLALRSDGVTDNFEESEEIDIMVDQSALNAARSILDSVLMRQNGTYTGTASLPMKPDNISDLVYVHGNTNVVAVDRWTTARSPETLDTTDTPLEADTRKSYNRRYLPYANLREALALGTFIITGKDPIYKKDTYELAPGFVNYDGFSGIRRDHLDNLETFNYAAYSTDPNYEGLVYKTDAYGYLYRGNQVRKGDTFVREGFGSLDDGEGTEDVGEWHDNILVTGFKVIHTDDGPIKSRIVDNKEIEYDVSELKGQERNEFTGYGHMLSRPYFYRGYWLDGVHHGHGDYEYNDRKKSIRRVGTFRKGVFLRGQEIDAEGNVTEYENGKPVPAISGVSSEELAREFEEPLDESIVNLNERPDGPKGFTGIGRFESHGVVYTGPWIDGAKHGTNGREENILFNIVRDGEWKEGIFWNGVSRRKLHDGNISVETYIEGRLESSTVEVKSETIAPAVEAEEHEEEVSRTSGATNRKIRGLHAAVGALALAAGAGIGYNLSKHEEEKVKQPEYSDVAGIDNVGSKLVAELDKTNPDAARLRELIAEAEGKIKYVDTVEEKQAVTALELFKKVAERKIAAVAPAEVPQPEPTQPSTPNSTTPPPGGVNSPF